METLNKVKVYVNTLPKTTLITGYTNSGFVKENGDILMRESFDGKTGLAVGDDILIQKESYLMYKVGSVDLEELEEVLRKLS